jgi:hypothetical protein
MPPTVTRQVPIASILRAYVGKKTIMTDLPLEPAGAGCRNLQ